MLIPREKARKRPNKSLERNNPTTIHCPRDANIILNLLSYPFARIPKKYKACYVLHLCQKRIRSRLYHFIHKPVSGQWCMQCFVIWNKGRRKRAGAQTTRPFVLGLFLYERGRSLCVSRPDHAKKRRRYPDQKKKEEWSLAGQEGGAFIMNSRQTARIGKWESSSFLYFMRKTNKVIKKLRFSAFWKCSECRNGSGSWLHCSEQTSRLQY